MKKRILITGLLLLITVLAAFAGYKYYQQQQESKTYTGTVEVTKVDITTKISGYLKDLAIKEGSSLTKGQTIASLDRADLAAALRRDQAALKKANAQLADLEKGARPAERQEAAANTAAAQAAFDKAEKDRLRQQSLYAAGASARQQFDDAQAAYDSALASLRAVKEKEALVLAGNREDQILAAREEVNRSTAVLEESSAALEDAIVTSPLNGLVLSKNFESGEYVAAGNPVATAADLSDCWIKVYLPSTELGNIKVGDSALVMIDSGEKRRFNAYVREISDTAEYTPRQSITKNERANMVFAVKVEVDNSEGFFKPGMPADVVFDD